MRKILLSACALAMAVGMNAQSVTITWPLQDGVSLSPVITGDGAEMVTALDATTGSALHFNGKKTLGNSTSTGTIVSPFETYNLDEPNTTGSHYVNFKFETKAGYTFTPTRVYFEGQKDGSGNNHYADVMYVANGTSTTLKTKYVFDRNNTTLVPFNQSITDIAAYSGEGAFVLNLYGKPGSTSKGYTFANVTVEGTIGVSGDTRGKAPISWNNESVTLKVRDSFVAPEFVNSENLPVSFSSSNSELVAVDEATGEMTLVEGKTGVAVITASFKETQHDKYIPTSVSTTITVNTNVVDAHQWVAYETLDAFPVDFMYTAGSAVAANTDVISDENVKVTSIFAAAKASYGKTIFGYNFSAGTQFGRVKDEPSASNPTGTKQDDNNSPLVVTPATDLQLVVFIRRQALEQSVEETDDVANNVVTRTHMWGMSENDGKGIYAVNQTAPTTKLPQQQIFGAYMNETAQGSNDYLTAAVVWDLKAGETYTIWTRGTTICMFAIGYVLPAAPVAPEAPALHIGGVEHTEAALDLAGENKIATFKGGEGHNIYYHFEKAVDNSGNNQGEEETPGLDVLANAETIEHDGKTFTIVPTEGVELKEAGTLSYFAHDPATDLKSEVKTLAVTGKGVASGIADINVDNANAPVEYFNLQGMRVDNPSNGIFIRRQGNEVSKVVIK